MAKIWKKLGLIILIILCLVNIISKLATKITLSDELRISSKKFSIIKNDDVTEKQPNNSNVKSDSVSSKNEGVENKSPSSKNFSNEVINSQVVEITYENSVTNSENNEMEVIISE